MEGVIKTIKIAEGAVKPANYLDKILMYKRKEVERLIQETKANPGHPLNKILNQMHTPRTHFAAALRGPKLAVIGEVKRRSPTRGEIRQIADPVALALDYCRGGASAISVLTDAEGF